MKKVLKAVQKGIVVAVLGVAGTTAANAAIIDLVSQGSNWNYTRLSTDLWGSWGSVNYGTFDFSSASWNNGNAAFGNTYLYSTYWAASTDLALQQAFNFSGTVNGDLTLNVAADNGFAIFLNGVQLAKANAEGFTNYWEYTYTVSAASLVQGVNRLEAFAEDHGGATYFDMRLFGDVIPQTQVPEPASIVLLGLGLAGLAARRRGKR